MERTLKRWQEETEMYIFFAFARYSNFPSYILLQNVKTIFTLLLYFGLKGATSRGVCRFLVLTILELIVGNLTHEKHYRYRPVARILQMGGRGGGVCA